MTEKIIRFIIVIFLTFMCI